MHGVQARTALTLERSQRGDGPKRREELINLNPFATRRSNGRWYAIRSVRAPDTELKRLALELLLAGHLQTPTPTQEEITTAAQIRDASMRPTVDTSPEVATVKPTTLGDEGTRVAEA